MKKEPLYILTYDHGGYVLWKDAVKPRLKDIKRWMKQYPKLRIGLDYESFTFDEFSRCDPEVVRMIGELLKEYPDRIGLGATTYGQPLSLYISEESNVRQLSYAVKTNLSYFGITPDVYCISEFALNNQTPQLIKLCGYKAAILRSHVMGYGYTKTFSVPYGMWKGKDGTEVPAVPVYDGQGRGYNCTTLDNWILSRWPDDTEISLEDFREKFKNYSPLLASRYDDLTQPIEKVTAEIEKHNDYKYVLLEDIPTLFGEPKEVLDISDNDFHSQMPWGYCGNEIFIGCRQGEVNAVQAEKLNALSVILGGNSLQKKNEEAWKYILAAQHHDVTICGLLDLARRFIPASLKLSDEVKEEAFRTIEKHFASSDNKSLFVMNPHSFSVDTWIKTPVDEDVYAEDTESEIITKEGKKYLNTHIILPALTAKAYKFTKEKNTSAEEFSYNKETGEVLTPLYKAKLNCNGIISLTSRENGKVIFSSENGALFTANVNGEDVKSRGEWTVSVNAHSLTATHKGCVGNVKSEFIMTFNGKNHRIDCKTVFELHGDKVGRNDITEGRPVPLTVCGHNHDDKLCFVMDLNLEKDREMFRDLPYSVAKWDGQLRKTEEYWYSGDRILVDTPVSPEESFNGTTHLQGVYWVALRDTKNGLAVINKGCMGSAVKGNRVLIPLLYANEYMCGTKMLDGVFTDEFALLPFGADFDNTDIHKEAMNYNYEALSRVLGKGNGNISEYSISDFSCDNNAVILTSLYPEDGHITARFCNFSEKNANAVFAPAKGNIISETDLLGNDLSEVKNNTLTFRPWEIKTVRI